MPFFELGVLIPEIGKYVREGDAIAYGDVNDHHSTIALDNGIGELVEADLIPQMLVDDAGTFVDFEDEISLLGDSGTCITRKSFREARKDSEDIFPQVTGKKAKHVYP